MTLTIERPEVEGGSYEDSYLDTLPKMQFWMPLQKSFVEGATGRRICQGFASTPDWDAQGESVIQSGIDFGPLLARGFVNWNHQDHPSAVIGVPLEARITKSKAQKPAMFVKSALYEDIPAADAAWNLMRVLEKSEDRGLPRRNLGWSVQGGVAERRGGYVVKSIVRMLALTHEPVNAATFAELAKSMAAANGKTFDPETFEKSATMGSDSSLLLQNLAGSGKKSAAEVCMALFGKQPDECQQELGRFTKGRVGMFTHLVYHQGWPIGEAETLVRGLHKSLTN